MLSHRKIVLSAALAFVLSPLSSQAWDANGHIIVAQIAYDNLTTVAKQDVDYLISKTDFGTAFPSFTPFIYSAPWPDYFNYEVHVASGPAKVPFNFLQGEAITWHYMDDPIVVGNYQPAPVSVSNSVWAVNYLVPHLSELLSQKKYDVAAYDLVYITHIVGDIHQPLHNANLYDSDFPTGDVGGNLYKITSTFGAKELHAAWDQSLGQFSSWKKSSSATDHNPSQTDIEKTAAQFETLCANDPKITDLNPSDWEKESHALALSYVYPMNNPNAPAIGAALSDDYISGGQKIADDQMCIAGRRLAAILNGIFTTPISGNVIK